MFAQFAKDLFSNAVSTVVGDISKYTIRPGKDFTKGRKIPADKLLSFLVSQGSSSTKNELLDFYDLDISTPTASAINQQRAKLKPEAMESLFNEFNKNAAPLREKTDYVHIAVDGTTQTFLSYPAFTSEEYYVSEGHSKKGFYSMHVNAFYDLDTRTYTDALIQPAHEKDEFKAFCHMVDRHNYPSCTKTIFIGDRGYCSYNNMAHVIDKGQFFLFRTKDIHSKGLVGKFVFPKEESFDITVMVTLVRSNLKSIEVTKGYKRFVDKATSFDFVEYGSLDCYELSFRVVRFPLEENSYECIVTNLPVDEFPKENIKKLYFKRWAIETSFRKLKYTIGLSNFHSYKPEFVQQEIWARLISYNITELVINHVALSQNETKYVYKVNFSMAAHICRIFFRLTKAGDKTDIMSLLQRELIPIRDERSYPRLKTAHFRTPRYFTYRAA